MRLDGVFSQMIVLFLLLHIPSLFSSQSKAIEEVSSENDCYPADRPLPVLPGIKMPLINRSKESS
jgi:hypothetical protein